MDGHDRRGREPGRLRAPGAARSGLLQRGHVRGRVPQPVGQAAGDREGEAGAGIGRRGPQLVEGLGGEDEADRGLDGDDARRSRPAVDEGELAEGGAAGDRAEAPSAAAAGEPDVGRHLARADEVEAVRRVALLEHHGAGMEDLGDDPLLDRRHDLGGQAQQEVLLGERDHLLGQRVVEPVLVEQLGLAPLEGGVRVGEPRAGRIELAQGDARGVGARLDDPDGGAGGGQLRDEAVEEGECGGVDARHASHVDDDPLRVVVAQDDPHQGLDGGERLVAAQLVDDDGRAVRVEHVALALIAQATGACGVGAVGAAQPRPDPLAGEQEVQAEALGDPLAGGHAPHAVALRVQPRAVGGQAQLSGEDGGDGTAHPALGRQADAVEPLAGVVVHPARRHHGQHGGDDVAGDDLDAGERVHSRVRERGGHDGEVLGRHHDRALPEVVVDLLLDVLVEQVRRSHEVRDGPVPVARGPLRLEDLLVHGEGATREGGQPVEDTGELLLAGGTADEGRRDDRPGVDHRVVGADRDVIEADRVERVAGRLGAHLREHGLGPAVREGEGVDEGLGDRLDGEGDELARRVEVAVEGGDGESADGGIGLGELGDVGRDLAAVEDAHLAPHVLEEAVDRVADGTVHLWHVRSHLLRSRYAADVDDGADARSPGGGHPDLAVLVDDAVLGAHAEDLHGPQVEVGGRLAVDDVVGGHDHVEQAGDPHRVEGWAPRRRGSRR